MKWNSQIASYIDFDAIDFIDTVKRYIFFFIPNNDRSEQAKSDVLQILKSIERKSHIEFF